MCVGVTHAAVVAAGGTGHVNGVAAIVAGVAVNVADLAVVVGVEAVIDMAVAGMRARL